MPKLTEAGKRIAAPLLDGGGEELKYHKFSVWMHKDRRLALFTASNVDWRARKQIVDGKKTNRDTLAGFPPDSNIAEQWVSDPRIEARHQLPDVFYSEDRGAFDKGHLVRRDDDVRDVLRGHPNGGNGDTYHVTNCSPQTKPFNQGAFGEENWGGSRYPTCSARPSRRWRRSSFMPGRFSSRMTAGSAVRTRLVQPD